MKDVLRLRSLLTAMFTLAVLVTSLDAQGYPTELYDNLRWQNIGPARGGRSTAAAGSDARPLEYYFGASGGGLWKTEDAGTTWNPVTDGQIGSASVSAVQVCESNPDVVYIGTGETEIRGNIQQGDGVYRSDDAGETLGPPRPRRVAELRADPDPPRRLQHGMGGGLGSALCSQSRTRRVQDHRRR